MDDFIKVYDNAVSDGQCDQIVQQFEASQNTYRGTSGPEVDPNIKDSLDLNITSRSEWAATNALITDAVFKCLIDYMGRYPFMLVGANIPIFKHPETGEVCKLTYENFDEFGRPYIDTLIARVSSGEIDEVVLAMNATLEGQTTAHYLAERLESHPVRITQLAHGLPVGGELDYLDDGTLAQALRARSPIT